MSQSQKTLEFLQKLKDSGHWNDDYNYSEVAYVSAKDKVIVIDKKWNSRHRLSPDSMIRKGSKCILRNSINKQDLCIKMFNQIHGLKYDYSKFNYISNSSKSIIICSEHGEFLQTPSKHMFGKGCPSCAKNAPVSFKNLLKEYNKVHKNKYDYSLSDYQNSKIKIKIICPVHGVFEQSPYSHKKFGCAKCSGKGQLTTEEFIERSQKLFSNKYDYSKAIYKSQKEKVLIVCKDHGEFSMLPANHYRNKQGCPKCSGYNKSTDEVVKEFIKIKGDEYDYSKVKYVDSKSKLIIICKTHGSFKQTYNNHLKGGCPQCAGNLKYSIKDLFTEFNKIHNNTYDYSNIKSYRNTKSKISIICPQHGYFKQSVAVHLKGGGCPKCAGKNLTSEEVIADFKKIHGSKYDYSKVNYVKTLLPVEIICRIHGGFKQLRNNHLKGQGCPKCGIINNALNQRLTIEEFVKKSIKVHGDKYNYSKVKYRGNNKKVIIDCQTHGEFLQTPSKHMFGQGCPTCNSGWNYKRVINFINDIRNEDILNMDPVELNMLIAQGKLPKEFEELVFTLEGTKENSLKTLKEKLGIEEEEISEDRAENLSEKLEGLTSSYDDELNDAISAIETPSIEDVEFSESEQKKRDGLPSISNEDILVLDKELIGTCDDEAVEFFIQYKLKKVWNEVINDKREVDDVKALNGGRNSSRLRDLFLEEYNKVIAYTPPKGYAFQYQPNMMQKLTVQRVKDYKRYGNWSGTGAGKTISFIIASREIDSRLTVVICLNSTVSQLEEDILDVYPDSLIHSNFKKGQKFDRSKHNYLLLNYEKFQQGYTEEIFQDLNENNLIDFIVLDEVHNSKQRDKNESQRRAALMRLIGRSAQMNTNFHLLGMSATPVINNLIEAKSLLQLITGKKYEDINTRGTISNALKIFNQLLLNGVRYIPKYDIILKELTAENTPLLNIDGSDLTDKLKDNSNNDYLGLEKILLESKLTLLDDYLKPKTIIYTYFTDKDRIPKRVAKYVKSKGYSYALYIGEQSTAEREQSKRDFINGDVDVLIASRTIGTGVDGLQNVCNRMVLLTLPWTDSEYTQLKGRIYRQGSKFGDVEIVIPQVYVDLEDKRWSWDKQRLQLIREKRTLADAAVDGIIPSKHIPSRQKLCSDSLQALRSWKERVNDGKVTSVERKDLVLPLRPEIVEHLRASLGDFSEMNKSWSTTKSENTFKRLKNNKKEWYYYHDLYKKRREDWDEIPYLEIAKKIKERPEWIVADMGCGENLLSKEVSNKVHAFDYVAIDKDVTACDMSSIPLQDNEIDAIVFCLSLMGSNYLDYIREAFRVTKPYGSLFICEPKKKVEKRLEVLKKEIESTGFKVVEVTTSSQFIYIQGIKL
jgi:superfamily II DNA or RNA helicase